MAEDRAYLDLVAQRLSLDDSLRRDVLDELGAHLEDTRAELIEAGRSEADATTQAIARLGPATDLARDIVRAHQTPRTLLSAVGWGAITTGRLALGGWLVTLGFTAAAAAGLAALGISVTVSTVALVLPGVVFAAVALYLAGQRLPAVIAERAHRTMTWSVRATMAAGLILVPVALVAIPAAHTAASVIATLAVPAAFALGVRNGVVRAGSRLGLDVRAPMVGAFVVIVAVVSAPPEPPSDLREFATTEAVDGQSAAGRLDRRAVDSAGIGGTCCPGMLLVAYPDPAVLAGYRDLRFELWPAVPGETEMALERHHGSLLTLPARPGAPRDDGPAYSHPGSDEVSYQIWFEAPLRWTGSRDPIAAYSLFTGVDQGGARAVLARADFETLRFDGSVLEWILAGPAPLEGTTPTTEAPQPASPAP